MSREAIALGIVLAVLALVYMRVADERPPDLPGLPVLGDIMHPRCSAIARGNLAIAGAVTHGIQFKTAVSFQRSFPRASEVKGLSKRFDGIGECAENGARVV